MSTFAVFVEYAGQKHQVGTAYQQRDGSLLLDLGKMRMEQATAASSRGGASAASGAVFPPFGRKRGQPIAGCDLENLEWYRGVVEKSVNDPSKARFRDKNQEVLSAIEAEIVRQGGEVSGKILPDERQLSYGSTRNEEDDNIPF